MFFRPWSSECSADPSDAAASVRLPKEPQRELLAALTARVAVAISRLGAGAGRQQVARVGRLPVRPAVDGLEGDVQPEVLAGVAVRDALHRLHGICTAAALSRRAKDEKAQTVARTERGGVADERRDVCPRAMVVPHVVLAAQRVRVQALVHPTPLVTLGAAEVSHVRFEAAIDEKVVRRLPTHMAFPQEV